MIECVFTLDYEIYGNGTGALETLVYEPGERLRNIFKTWNARFVNFVEVAEFERIEACGADPAIELVKQQIKTLHHEGFEIALHLHPQWFNARYDAGKWTLDYSEYNLCTLSRTRIAQIVTRSIDYLRYVLDEPEFTPLSFRAGNWLFQPTRTAASVLAENGLKIDSSVFKGGIQHAHGLDYRRSLKNGYYWSFESDVNEPDLKGSWIEAPIYTEMIPSWKMATSKRVGMANGLGVGGRSVSQKVDRLRDLLRFRYPLKFDFCRMTLSELTSMMDRVILEDRKDPSVYRPLVAIGHTKDLVDPQTVDAFLSYLRSKKIEISTLREVYSKIVQINGGPYSSRVATEPGLQNNRVVSVTNYRS